MKRYYTEAIQKYQSKKITLISGPRQCGKTTLSKMLTPKSVYLNYDSEEDRSLITTKSWDRKSPQIIFDELHKMKNWKQWIKGIFDTEQMPPAITVTGSARLETHQKVGDSLAGRYFQYRLHPLDIRELYQLNNKINVNDTVNKLLTASGFPEAFLENDPTFYTKWKKTHLDIMLRQDLIDLENVRNIKGIEILIQLLKKRVGSPISCSSLSNDLGVSDKTIKKWLSVLEDMYIVFKVLPFHKNIARSNKKQPKYYFFDTAQINSSPGAQIENLVACSLYKEVQFREDCLGQEAELFYLSKAGGIEIDFAIFEKEKIKYAIEVKLSSDSLSKSFSAFKRDLPDTNFIQLVHNLRQERTYPSGEKVRSLAKWLSEWV